MEAKLLDPFRERIGPVNPVQSAFPLSLPCELPCDAGRCRYKAHSGRLIVQEAGLDGVVGGSPG